MLINRTGMLIRGEVKRTDIEKAYMLLVNGEDIFLSVHKKKMCTSKYKRISN